ncbi:sigma-54-dependent Fis family transcriptional regulator [Endozoicomonas sp. SM1973]|uniref:Sigma-54-dependent Fis family transcriptional regulator n=1 Tax=Spartinivicinus marinus TaxID=2994442 RepID=A0A853I691_9GAMM|nr:sigma-54 dependent transcriptional regulator [Spartinivicinus marinus]MCX4028593.1 sigma-54 dependent transcriptional regulator [Spartinivicinus marinus]NYZ67142.1 sigma-54-dependent Fis family transcriptional regulator [Spartinivicinus marinus]
MQNNNGKILIVDDERANILILGEILSSHYDVSIAISGEQVLKLLFSEFPVRHYPDLILLDILMPGIDGFDTCQKLKSNPHTRDIPIIFISMLNSTTHKLDAFTNGAVDYITKPFEAEEVLARVRTHITVRHQITELAQKNRELSLLNNQLLEEKNQRRKAEAAFNQASHALSALSKLEAEKWGIATFVGKSKAVMGLLTEIRRLHHVSKTNVLILGESGTGKELVARAVHFGSSRSSGPFIAVNCSAIPEELADATFFGSIKGAYTGSQGDRKGYFEAANGGTLFLDEMGEMPLRLQAKLLRVLEEGKIIPVGDVKERDIDVRIIAATHVDLQQAIADKVFRQDLYFRLSGYCLQTPPLRERQEDIELLANHFLAQLVDEMAFTPVSISYEAIKALEQYAFPGNVRELRNFIEYALIRSGGNTIMPYHLPLNNKPIANLHFDSSRCSNKYDLKLSNTKNSSLPIYSNQNAEAVILDYLAANKCINNNQCQKLLNITHQRASYLLKKLHRSGQLMRVGERRWAYYTLV